MADSYDTTPFGSPVINRIVLPEDPRPPCSEGHIWDIDAEPDAPVHCICCGAEYRMTAKEKSNLRHNLENLGESS